MKILAEHEHPRAVFLLGATAVGKTELSIRLANAIDGEIISADSRCLYRGMNIGTAKPSKRERQQITHHLLDVADADEVWSLGKYKQFAISIGLDIVRRGKIPIFVGGTGQYYRAIAQGWAVPQISPSPVLRRVLIEWAEEIGAKEFHEKLRLIDPEAAKVNDPQNVRRTVRALEVILSTGRKFSSWRTTEELAFNIFTIGLHRDRQDLFTRADLRIDQMLKDGLVAEVQRLRTEGITDDMPSMSAIGYREISAFLRGDLALEEAVLLMKRNTKSFIRRQSNWFKLTDPDIHWYTAFPDPLEKIVSDLNTWGVK
jgi:tRNA dimethylallyltransferase